VYIASSINFERAAHALAPVHIASTLRISVTMGCGMSTEDKEGKVRNEEIENQLKRDKLLQRNEIKMLLLGMSTYTLLRISIIL
jgi:hypothetical protein